MHKYVFYIVPLTRNDFHTTGIRLDAFAEVNIPKKLDKNMFMVARKFDPTYMDEEYEKLRSMALRQRFAMSFGPYVVNCPYEIKPKELESFLNEKFKEGTLKEFLKLCSIGKSSD